MSRVIIFEATVQTLMAHATIAVACQETSLAQASAADYWADSRSELVQGQQHRLRDGARLAAIRRR
jgi:hypothetical protein